jgi:hypothetical protein
MHSHKTVRWFWFVVLFGCRLLIHVQSAFLLDNDGNSKSLSQYSTRVPSTSGSAGRGILSIQTELRNMSQDDDGWATIPEAKTKRRHRKNKNSNLHKTNNNNNNNNISLTRFPAATTFVPIHVEFIPPTDTTLQFQSFMILLCGLPGSGKSTFARALEQAMPYKVRKR